MKVQILKSFSPKEPFLTETWHMYTYLLYTARQTGLLYTAGQTGLLDTAGQTELLYTAGQTELHSHFIQLDSKINAHFTEVKQ